MRPVPNVPPCEPALGISMRGDVVVIHARSRLDRCSTETLVLAVAGATRSGATVLIDLERAHDSPGPDRSDVQVPAGAAAVAAWSGSRAVVLGGGRVQLGFGDRCWTLDLAARRFCRSAGPVLPNFVQPDHWTAMTSIRVTTHQTTVVTPDGTMFSAPVSWEGDTAMTARGRAAGSATTAA